MALFVLYLCCLNSVRIFWNLKNIFACLTLYTPPQDSKFGSAGNIVIIEERLEGFEVSVFGITDGKCHIDT